MANIPKILIKINIRWKLLLLESFRHSGFAFMAFILTALSSNASSSCEKSNNNHIKFIFMEHLEDREFNPVRELKFLIEESLQSNTNLINEPIFRIFWAYSEGIQNDYLGVIAHTEAATRLAMNKDSCDFFEIMDMAQSLRISFASAHVLSNEEDKVVFDGFISILPDSKGNKLRDYETVFCDALISIAQKDHTNQQKLLESCKAWSTKK